MVKDHPKDMSMISKNEKYITDYTFEPHADKLVRHKVIKTRNVKLFALFNYIQTN